MPNSRDVFGKVPPAYVRDDIRKGATQEALAPGGTVAQVDEAGTLSEESCTLRVDGKQGGADRVADQGTNGTPVLTDPRSDVDAGKDRPRRSDNDQRYGALPMGRTINTDPTKDEIIHALNVALVEMTTRLEMHQELIEMLMAERRALDVHRDTTPCLSIGGSMNDEDILTEAHRTCTTYSFLEAEKYSFTDDHLLNFAHSLLNSLSASNAALVQELK